MKFGSALRHWGGAIGFNRRSLVGLRKKGKFDWQILLLVI